MDDTWFAKKEFDDTILCPWKWFLSNAKTGEFQLARMPVFGAEASHVLHEWLDPHDNALHWKKTWQHFNVESHRSAMTWMGGKGSKTMV